MTTSTLSPDAQLEAALTELRDVKKELESTQYRNLKCSIEYEKFKKENLDLRIENADLKQRLGI